MDCFNPRPPRGGRPPAGTSRGRMLGFNPRPPRGGRRNRVLLLYCLEMFQSTPPAWGATDCVWIPMDCMRGFNPRPPRGGRREQWADDSIKRHVSIHAPRVGGDSVQPLAPQWKMRRFNPRPPRGGRHHILVA